MNPQHKRDGVAAWPQIAKLISQRWPSWEPNEQERADWRRVIGYREFDLIDEAMLAVRSKYSSAVPALKWILSEYDRLKRERYEATREQSRAEEEQSVAETMREVAADRGRCMAYLRRQATEQLAHAADGVRRQYGWAVPTTTNDDIETWGWAMRYAVAFALADAERGAA